jgi:glutathione synthase/RimK-type ligase-like ATP-grasp enzyme
MRPIAIGALVDLPPLPERSLVARPAPPQPVPPPERRPLGRAALRLQHEGIEVVFGDRLRAGRMDGLVARPGEWLPVTDVAVVALHDRFPSQTYPERFAHIVKEAGALPIGNPPALVRMCRDKLETQRFLERRGFVLPEVEADPAHFAARLSAWGQAFLKPRHGGLGRGIRLVRPGDSLPAFGEGVVPGREDVLFLQRAVAPPKGWAGQSLRVLAQREPHGDWVFPSSVLRCSREDPVVNVARGADVALAEDALSPDAMTELCALCLAVCQALLTLPEAEWVVEVGIDAVVDERGAFHVIELNHRPQGRLEVVASQHPDRFDEAHVEACARPFRRLAACLS